MLLQSDRKITGSSIGRPTDDINGKRVSMHIRMRPSVKGQLNILSSRTGRTKIDIIEDGIRRQDDQIEFTANGKDLRLPNGQNLKESIYDNVPINSPLRYAGGKFYARKLISEHMIPHTYYIEPFAGGGSIFFYKEKVESNWLNDLDENLIRVFRYIRDYPEELIDWLAGRKAAKGIHNWYKNQFKPNQN